VYAVNDTEVAWVAHEADDYVQYMSVERQLRSAGHASRPALLELEQGTVGCVVYPRGGTNLEQQDATDEENQAIQQLLHEWVASFERAGVCFFNFHPKHILRAHGGGFLLTGLHGAFPMQSPPSPMLLNFGPFSPVGETPMCFFTVDALTKRGTLRFCMHHARAVCATLIDEQKGMDVMATADFASTAIQIRLSLANDIGAVLLRESQRPSIRCSPDIVEKAIAILVPPSSNCCIIL
jgi:hypothetical protein